MVHTLWRKIVECTIEEKVGCSRTHERTFFVTSLATECSFMNFYPRPILTIFRFAYTITESVVLTM